MHNYKGLFVGLTAIDIQYFTDEFPEPNVKVKTKPPDILVGGPATNAAVAFAHLNNGAFLATPTGQNPFSAIIYNDFINTKITHFDLIKSQNSYPVIATVITSNNNGDRTIFTHHPKKINSEISVKQLFTKVNPDIIMLDGFYPEFSIECAKLAKSRNIPVVMDGGSWKPQFEELLKHADFIICSDDFYPPGSINTNDVINFLRNYNIKHIAITRGDKNVIYQNYEKRGEIKIDTIIVKDTLGAGDFFHGAFCYYILELQDFDVALEKASKIAATSCRNEGTRKWLNVKKN